MKVILLIAEDGRPPLSVLATAKVVGISVAVKSLLPSGYEPAIILPPRSKLVGTKEILRYFSWKGPRPLNTLHDRENGKESRKIYEMMEKVNPLFCGSDDDFERACEHVDECLVPGKTHLVGHGVSVSDLLVWSYLVEAGEKWECLMKSNKYKKLGQWYDTISTLYAPILEELVPPPYFKNRYLGKKLPPIPLTPTVMPRYMYSGKDRMSFNTTDKTHFIFNGTSVLLPRDLVDKLNTLTDWEIAAVGD